MRLEVKRKEFESLALLQLDYVERKIHQCTVLLKDKIVIDTLTASNVHPTQAVVIFHNISMAFGTLTIH